MNEEQTPGQQTDEIGGQLESENEVNEAIKEQGEDAAVGIPRAADAAKHEQEQNEDNEELQGAP